MTYSVTKVLTPAWHPAKKAVCLNAFCPVDIKEIRALIDLMKKNGLAVFKMKKEGFKIALEMAGTQAQPLVQTYAAAPVALPAPPVASSAPAASSGEAVAPSNLKEITSPMVGTFYASSSPDAPPYVTVGQTVTPDTVVCIIEAMKVMNEIKAEAAGVIAEIVAENGKPVQFGQALFRVK